MGKVFYKEIDIIKGIAIFLVLMEHCYAIDFINVTHDVPQMFHYAVTIYAMELFMMCSGFLYSRHDFWPIFLKKKSKRLLVPYLFFGVITILTRVLLSDYTVSSKPDLGLAFKELLFGGYYWFLYVLFIFVIVFKPISNKKVLISIAVVSFLGSYIYNGDSFILTRLIHHPFYFILGMFIREYYDKIRIVLNSNYSYWLLLVLFILYLASLTNFIQEYENHHLSQIFGSSFTWIAAYKISQASYNFVTSFFDHLGRYSLQYYLNHLRLTTISFFLISRLCIENGVVNYILAIIMVVVFSFIALSIEKRIKVLRFLCGLR